MLRVIARMNVGGPALQVTTLARGLDQTAFDQRTLVGHVGDDEADYLDLRDPGVPVTRIDGLGRSIRAAGDARAFGALLAEIRRFRPHIVHTHTAKAGVLGRLAAWVSGVPATVHTFHGHLLHGYFSPAVTASVRQVERVLAPRTTRLVAVGARVRDELLAAGIGRAGQFVVVPPGVSLPVPPSRGNARRVLGLPDEGFVVAYVARLIPVKRPDRFVTMARRLADRRDDVRFVVAGEGPLLESARAAGQGLGDRLRFLGWRSDVQAVYGAADVVVLTSDNEGMPVSLIEASMAGRPVVTTAVGSAAEVVRDGVTGLVTSIDADHLAAAVDRLLDDEALRERLGAAAAHHAQRSFSASRLVADTEALYRELLQEKALTRSN